MAPLEGQEKVPSLGKFCSPINPLLTYYCVVALINSISYNLPIRKQLDEITPVVPISCLSILCQRNFTDLYAICLIYCQLVPQNYLLPSPLRYKLELVVVVVSSLPHSTPISFINLEHTRPFHFF